MEKQESLDFVLSFVKFASFNMRFAVFIVSVHFLFLNVVSLISLHTVQSPFYFLFLRRYMVDIIGPLPVYISVHFLSSLS